VFTPTTLLSTAFQPIVVQVNHLFTTIYEKVGCVVRRGCVCEPYERVCENPVMTFTIKKRFNTVLFIDRIAALYIGNTRIRVLTNEGDQPVEQADWRIEYTMCKSIFLV